MPEPANAKALGERLTEIGKRAARSQVDPGAYARAGDQQRDVLARMIGARCRRIVAVIGRHDQEIVVAKRRQQLRQSSDRTARDSARSRRRRCGDRRAYRNRPDSRTAALDRPRTSGSRPGPSPRRRSLVWMASVVPRPANRSSILPIATTGRFARFHAIEQRFAARRQARNRAGSPFVGTDRARPRTDAQSPDRRRALRPRACTPTSQARYSSGTGTTSSCAAI